MSAVQPLAASLGRRSRSLTNKGSLLTCFKVPSLLIQFICTVTVGIFSIYTSIPLTDIFSECWTWYHNNYKVVDGIWYYYQGIPDFLQVSKHQYIERQLLEMWVSHMLVGWWVIHSFWVLQMLSDGTARFSATNCAKVYNMALSGQEACAGWCWMAVWLWVEDGAYLGCFCPP
jgi:hypothetical protein